MLWQANHSTGLSELDRQHKALCEMIDEFREVIANGSGEASYEGFLEFLSTYAGAHFQYERAQMLTGSGQGDIADEDQHSFTRALKAEMAIFHDQGYSERRVLGFLDIIDGWLGRHIHTVKERHQLRLRKIS
ncbi:MAG: hemerythrin domain-containing protein [Paracoccaceae bacterium]|nr:hemerythrin domain-containing protein [Paracoccaceae bacterium]